MNRTERESAWTAEGEKDSKRNPAVKYPNLFSEKQMGREKDGKDREKASGEDRHVRQTVWKILRILLYIAFAVWALLNCRRAWPVMPGMEIRMHLFFFLLVLLLPAVLIDLLLRLCRRFAFGKENSARMKRDNWALTGLVVLLAFVMIVWYLLWTYVVRDIAMKPK